MRELPRQLTVEQLAELFEGRTRLVELLAPLEDPLSHAREVALKLSKREQQEVLAAHPAIGGQTTSVRSAPPTLAKTNIFTFGPSGGSSF